MNFLKFFLPAVALACPLLVSPAVQAGEVEAKAVEYSGAVHSFTHPGAGHDNSKGAAYNAAADARSWQAMKTFFDEIFAPSAK